MFQIPISKLDTSHAYYDIKHVITLQKWTDNDSEHIDHKEQNHIWILSRVIDHVIDLKQSTETATRLRPMTASTTPPIIDRTKIATGLETKIHYLSSTSYLKSDINISLYDFLHNNE